MQSSVQPDPFAGCLANLCCRMPNTTLTTTTAYFPPAAWFLEARKQGNWTWEAHENYQKGGWRNRCRIAAANGPQLLSIPLAGGKHARQPVREVRISYRTDWQRQHAQTIRSAYGRAPYFEYYGEEVLEALLTPGPLLYDYNLRLSRQLLRLLGWPLPIEGTQEFSGGDAGTTPPARGVEPYPQVFIERHGFLDGLSILDALFCLGPECATLNRTS